MTCQSLVTQFCNSRAVSSAWSTDVGQGPFTKSSRETHDHVILIVSHTTDHQCSYDDKCLGCEEASWPELTYRILKGEACESILRSILVPDPRLKALIGVQKAVFHNL